MNRDRDFNANDRREGGRNKPGRRDDDRSRTPRSGNERPGTDRPGFNHSPKPGSARLGSARPGQDRPRFNSDNKPRFERRDDKPGSDRPGQDRSRFNRDDRPGSDRPRFERRDDKPRFGGEDRPRFNRDDRPGSDRRPAFNRDDKPRGNGEERPRFNRDDKPGSDRPRFERRDDKPRFGGEDRPRFNRDDKPGGDRRPAFNRDDKPGSDRPRFERRDDKPRGDREDRPRFNRDDKPGGDRPRFERRDDKPRFGGEDRPRLNRDDKPERDPKHIEDSKERRVGRYDKAPTYNLDNIRENLPKSRKKASKPEEPKKKPVNDGTIRLNRYIANAGICSRREADDLIARGDISVNGKVVTEMGFKVKESDVVKFGTKVLNPEKMVYVLLNKPKDFITTTDDPEERRTVMELVADAGPYRIYPVGRLDRNTTGLLLLTNDGELAEKLTHPSNNVKKIYQAELDKPLTEEHFDAIRNGIELEDGAIKPDDLGIVTPDAHVIGIEIHSGRNRIVRRIFEHFGYEVAKLDRTTYATLTKKELPRGKWRFLEPKEVVKLKYF